MSKRSKRNTRREHTPQYDAVTLHLLPVQPSATRPEGVVVCVEAIDEEGETVKAATIRCSNKLDVLMAEVEKELREKSAPGIWRVDAHSNDEVDELIDSIAEAVTEADIDFGLCDGCEIGEPCVHIWGPPGEMTVVPRTPPPAEVDIELVEAIADALIEAAEDDLVMETLQAAMYRFVARRPRPAAKTALTMTPKEAAKVLGLDLDELLKSKLPATLDLVYRKAVAEAHPDHEGGSPEKLHKVKEAKRALDAVFDDAEAEDPLVSGRFAGYRESNK